MIEIVRICGGKDVLPSSCHSMIFILIFSLFQTAEDNSFGFARANI